MSYLERKRQKEQPDNEADEEIAKPQGAAAAFSAAAKSRTEANKPKPANPDAVKAPKLVQNLPQTRKLLATAIAELEDLSNNH
jgi:hypothetical protein